MRKIKDQASTVQILTILSLCPAATAGLQVNLPSGRTRADKQFHCGKWYKPGRSQSYPWLDLATRRGRHYILTASGTR